MANDSTDNVSIPSTLRHGSKNKQLVSHNSHKSYQSNTQNFNFPEELSLYTISISRNFPWRKFKNSFSQEKFKTRKFPLTLESESATWTVLMANWRKRYWIFTSILLFLIFSLFFSFTTRGFFNARRTIAHLQSKIGFAVNFTLPTPARVPPLLLPSQKIGASSQKRVRDVIERKFLSMLILGEKFLCCRKWNSAATFRYHVLHLILISIVAFYALLNRKIVLALPTRTFFVGLFLEKFSHVGTKR